MKLVKWIILSLAIVAPSFTFLGNYKKFAATTILEEMPRSLPRKEPPMNHDVPACGLWSLVLINSAVFLIFAFSFTHPKTGRDWRSLGAFSAFIVALFAEMYS